MKLKRSEIVRRNRTPFSFVYHLVVDPNRDTSRDKHKVGEVKYISLDDHYLEHEYTACPKWLKKINYSKGIVTEYIHAQGGASAKVTLRLIDGPMAGQEKSLKGEFAQSRLGMLIIKMSERKQLTYEEVENLKAVLDSYTTLTKSLEYVGGYVVNKAIGNLKYYEKAKALKQLGEMK